MRKNKILFIEPFSGAAGDMFAAALLGLGADVPAFWKGIKSLPLEEKPEVSLTSVVRNGISARHFNVKLAHSHEHGHHQHRTLDEIEKIIMSACGLSGQVRKKSVAVFRTLAKAEAKIHGAEMKHVHFHEVGAADAIVDIVSAMLCLEILDIDKIVSAPVALGCGTVRTSHGVLPVPAPATAELLKGCPTMHGNIQFELTTPTGAAILSAIVDEWGVPPAGKITAISYGAGTKDFKDQANVLRTSIVDCEPIVEKMCNTVAVIECNIDDMPGEAFTHIGEEILGMGALDYAVIPAMMKKGRPGLILQVICKEDEVAKFADFILRETTTLGIRYRTENRIILRREVRKIKTPWGAVDVKVAFDSSGNILKCKPEYESCAKLAKASKTGYSPMFENIRAYLQSHLKR
ncbi:MAG: nickel pincer cofactor biosynthesis protein LarC [Lentisphaerae bacterium]|nr:nickel pincer cofactor biosynthesis protein LarC [Lentisphaerota bacterium]